MPYRLLIHRTEQSSYRTWLEPGENLVGSSDSSDIVIGDPSVSRNHAVFVVDGDRVQLADLGSVNGTFVAGGRIENIVDLQPGLLSFGSVSLELEFVPDGDAEASTVVSIAPLAAQRTETSQGFSSRGEATTTSGHPIQLFTLSALPELVNGLRQRSSAVLLAQLLGQRVLELFPVEAVIIERDGSVYSQSARSNSTNRKSDELGDADANGTSKSITRGTWVIELQGPRVRTLSSATRLFEACLGLLEIAYDQERSAGCDSEVDQAESKCTDSQSMVSLNPAMDRLLSQGKRVARGNVSVLILGESGTGKEVFARHLHAHSGRSPLVALNCAALPQDLLEAELFGIESGVATGVGARPGCFERADGGTLFLDEIGEMSLPVQAKVLRALETKEVMRLGASSPRPARARILAATNRDLAAMVEKEEFRLDLYHRIADWEVVLPPLRDRPEDLPNLLVLFLQQECVNNSVSVSGVSKDVLDLFLEYDWPGNVRELQREIRRSVLLLNDGDLLSTDVLNRRITGSLSEVGATLEDKMKAAEAMALRRALVRYGDKASAAAQSLDVPLSSFYRKLKTHGLSSTSDE